MVTGNSWISVISMQTKSVIKYATPQEKDQREKSDVFSPHANGKRATGT